MSAAVTPTPRDERIRVLSSMTRTALELRAVNLGYSWPKSVWRATSDDELRSLIVDAEVELGVTAR